MVRIYIRCWATNMFSVDPPRDYINNTEKKMEREGENKNKNENQNEASPRQSRKRVRLKIDYELL
jgi:hypothetical protein